MTTRAVLTGDLVNSTQLNPASLTRARQTLLAAAEEIEGWDKAVVGAQAEFFRGDSWQLLLMKPQFFLRGAIFLRASLRGADEDWDTRIAVGLGRVDKVDKQRTSLSSGEAFTLSGRTLDGIGAANMAVAAGPGIPGGGLAPLTHICSVLVDDWSQKQAQAARLALSPQPPTQAEMADRLGITQQSVSKTLAAAKIPALLQAIQYCERLNWKHCTQLI